MGIDPQGSLAGGFGKDVIENQGSYAYNVETSVLLFTVLVAASVLMCLVQGIRRRGVAVCCVGLFGDVKLKS